MHKSASVALSVGYCLASLTFAAAAEGSTNSSTEASEGYPWWVYLIIPFLSGIAGYVMNVIGVCAAFYPVEFTGIPLLTFKNQPAGFFGVQGLIPSKAEKLGGMAIDLIVNRLMDMRMIFGRLDANDMAKALGPGMETTMRLVIGRAAEQAAPEVWESIPEYVKNDIYQEALKTVPALFEGLLYDVKEDIDAVFDVKAFAVRKMTLDKAMTVRIFKKVGEEKFRFIQNGGFIFGFIFGIFQSLFSLVSNSWWVLPSSGLVAGLLTNYVAMKLVFAPIEPMQVGPWTFHGLFFRRQEQTSRIFAKLCVEEVFTAPQMWEEILFGPKADNFESLVRKHTKKSIVDVMEGNEEHVAQLLTPREFRNLLDRIADTVIEDMPNSIHLSYDYMDEALQLEAECRDKLLGLSYREFDAALHPVFEEDEMKLVLAGGIAGVTMGLIEFYLLFPLF